jgi:hypothetical protein
MTEHDWDEHDWDAYEDELNKQVSLLTRELNKTFAGYSRMVIVLACARSIAAMFGPAMLKSREDFLSRFPKYMRSMWRVMDETIGHERF